MAIYIVTHGEKHDGANPKMTEKGFQKVKKLRQFIPQNPSSVICGTGQRHIDVAEALDLEIDRFSAVIGSADSSQVIDDKKLIVLANGTVLEPSVYTTLKDLAPAAKQLVLGLLDDVIICAGRPLLKMLGYTEPKSGSVYKIDNGRITELVVTGETEEVSA